MINERYARERFSKTFLFDGINSDTAYHIILLARPEYRSYSGGSVIFSPGCFQRELGFVLSGEITEKISVNGKNVILQTLTGGDLFGAASLFPSDDMPYMSIVSAKTKTDIMFIGQKQIEHMVSNYSDIAMNYITFLSRQIRFLKSRVSLLTFGRAELRVGKFLFDAPVGDRGECVIPKISTLACMLDLGRASVYRAIDTLVDEKLIVRMNDGEIFIPNRRKMLEYLET